MRIWLVLLFTMLAVASLAYADKVCPVCGQVFGDDYNFCDTCIIDGKAVKLKEAEDKTKSDVEAKVVRGLQKGKSGQTMKCSDVIRLANVNATTEYIIAEIDASDSVFHPVMPSDIVRMQKQGVPQKVIDYIIIRNNGDVYATKMAPPEPAKPLLGGVQLITTGQFKARSDKELYFAYIIMIDNKEIVRRESWAQAYAIGNKITYVYDFETVQFQTDSGVHNLEIYLPTANHHIGDVESRTNRVFSTMITVPEDKWIQIKLSAAQDTAGVLSFSIL